MTVHRSIFHFSYTVAGQRLLKIIGVDDTQEAARLETGKFFSIPVKCQDLFYSFCPFQDIFHMQQTSASAVDGR